MPAYNRSSHLGDFTILDHITRYLETLEELWGYGYMAPPDAAVAAWTGCCPRACRARAVALVGTRPRQRLRSLGLVDQEGQAGYL
jgi:hypothetical protein